MNASSGDTLIQLVVATAGSGVLVAAIQGFFTRRKTKAETEGAGASATKMITDAAAGVVTMLTANNDRLESRVSRLEADLAACRIRCDVLVDWKEAAEDVLAASGLTVVVTPPDGVRKPAT